MRRLGRWQCPGPRAAVKPDIPALPRRDTPRLTPRPRAPQDMAPYVGVLVPDLQAALVDPLPEVRATAAKALGSLLRGMGEEHFQDLVPWLLTTLQSGVR